MAQDDSVAPAVNETSATEDLRLAKADDTAKPAKTPSIMGILWVAFLCSFVDFLGMSISIPILPYYTLELAWDESTTICPSCPQDASTTDFAVEGRCGEIEGCGTAIDVGLCASAFYGGQIIGNLVMSRLSDRVGRKIIVMISLSCSALGFLWCGLAPNLYHLYLARTFSGIAGGTLPVVQAMVLDVTGDPRERPKYFGIAGACLGMAFFIGPGVGAVIATVFTKQAALFAPAIIGFVVIIVGIFRIHETRPGGGVCGAQSTAAAAVYDQGAAAFAAEMAAITGGAPPPAAAANPKLPRTVYACAGAMMLAGFIFTAMTSMTALTWPISYNVGPTALGMFLTAYGAIGIFNNVVMIKWIIGKIGAEKLALAVSLLLGVGITTYTFIDLLKPGDMVLFVFYLIFFELFIGCPFDMHMPTLITIAGNAVGPENRGKATGLVAAAMSCGFALCPLAAGPLFTSDILRIEHKYGSFSHLMWVICGCLSLVEFAVLISVVGCGNTDGSSGSKRLSARTIAAGA